MNPRKGQLVSMDAAFSVVLGAATLMLVAWTLADVDRGLARSEQADALAESTAWAAHVLVSTPGWPQDWTSRPVLNATTVASIGLASDANRLDPEKTARFFGVLNTSDGYQSAREWLGLFEPAYDFRADLTWDNGTPFGSGGASWNGAAVVRSTSQRLVLLYGEPARLIVQAWRNEPE